MLLSSNPCNQYCQNIFYNFSLQSTLRSYSWKYKKTYHFWFSPCSRNERFEVINVKTNHKLLEIKVIHVYLLLRHINGDLNDGNLHLLYKHSKCDWRMLPLCFIFFRFINNHDILVLDQTPVPTSSTKQRSRQRWSGWRLVWHTASPAHHCPWPVPGPSFNPSILKSSFRSHQFPRFQEHGPKVGPRPPP